MKSTQRRSWLATPAFFFLLIAMPLSALDFTYKSAKDFKTLETFNDVDAFEASYADYVQDCFDNTGGGTGGIQCTQLEYELWDRELNIYYERLTKKLSAKQRTQLKESQRQWIALRDGTIAFNSALLDRRYDTQGTMYLLMRAGDAARIIAPMVKQRALMLKAMFELASQPPMSKDAE